jgi:serine/threonine protein phosphatase PrpC
MTQLRSGGRTDVGRMRQVNQDTPLLADNRQLWAVADGMGGHNGGEVASDLAVQSLQAHFGDAGRDLDALLDAAAAANTAVNDAAQEDPDLRGMGTTLVAIAVTDDDELAYVNIGDSRIYLFRDGELSRLTVDHSLVEEMVREGTITAEEARSHPRRNVVTRALGIEPWARFDGNTIVPYTGDRYLLCSDGLFNEVEEDRIAGVLRRLDDPADASSELVRLANEGGGRDNITVVVVDVVDDGGRAEAASGVVPTTATSSSPTSNRDDPAGFSAPPLGSGAGEVADRDPEPRLTRRQRRKLREKPKRFTWRVAVFLVAFAAVLGGATLAILQEARGTYFVTVDEETGFVTVFRGKPGGVLWFDPELVEATSLRLEDVLPNLRDEVEGAREAGSLDAAEAFVTNLTTSTTTTTTTSTTTSTSTTTTIPVVAPTPTP